VESIRFNDLQLTDLAQTPGSWGDLHRTELCDGYFYKPISSYILVTGVASGTATYVTSIVSNLTFTPLVLQLFGTKAAVVFGQLAYCIYICSNFYPSKGNFTKGFV